MTKAEPEFSRLVPLARLGMQPYRQWIEASPAEREHLARRFDLVSLDRLTAAVTLTRIGGGQIRLDAEFEAEFAQTCVVSLEPVPSAIRQSFVLVYGPAQADAEEIVLAADEPPFEPLTGDAIDIGEAIAQELSLSMPDFPRQADIEVETTTIGEADDDRFAPLANWRSASHK